MCRTRFLPAARSLWRGIFLADISDPASPKITLAQRGALLSDAPDKLRFHLEDGTQQEIDPAGEGPVLDHDLRQHRDSDSTAQQSDRAPRDLLPTAELGLHEPAQAMPPCEQQAAGAAPTYPIRQPPDLRLS